MTQPTLDADKHNFGRSVKLVTRASRRWFEKPRPVRWEHVFFGLKSPLVPLFMTGGDNGCGVLARYLFNLEVEQVNDWLGYSKEVNASTAEITDDHFYGFGVLIAYAYVFGIRDLHKFNLVRTSTHLQAIDAEVVLTDLILPNETVLLPFKDVAFDLCGLSGFGDVSAVVNARNCGRILAGYFDLFSLLYRLYPECLRALEKVIDESPVRLILRNTRLYRRHITGESTLHDLLPEERCQLDRGDIPYFFKRCGHDQLYWVSDDSGGISTCGDIGDFGRDVARHAQMPNHLLGDQDLIERKMVQGAFLLQKMFGLNETNRFFWNDGSLTVGPTAIENHATGHTFRTKTPTTANNHVVQPHG